MRASSRFELSAIALHCPIPVRSARVLALAGGALGCSLLAGLTALGMFVGTPDEIDCHCGNELSLFDHLADPHALAIFATATSICGAIGFAFALATLRSAPLSSSIPFVITTTVIAAGMSALIAPLLSPLIALVAGVGAMS